MSSGLPLLIESPVRLPLPFKRLFDIALLDIWIRFSVASRWRHPEQFAPDAGRVNFDFHAVIPRHLGVHRRLRADEVFGEAKRQFVISFALILW